jgi:hypothetical protein
MSQTGLSKKELFEELKNPSCRYIECLIVNDIGKLCENTDEKSRKEGEEALREILKSSSDKINKITAFFWLSVLENLGKRTLLTLKEFKNNPDNKALVQKAQRSIEKYKENQSR